MRQRSAWQQALADPAIRAIGLYALVAIVATVAAYMTIFTSFVEYDDEGTLLVSLDAFVRGDPLYVDVFSPYGPFYFEFFGGFFALTGIDIGTDVSRTIVIAIWVGTSLLIGLACQRLTGRLLLGVTGMVVAFAVLYALYPEPMHPHGLVVLALSGFVLLAVRGPGRHTALTAGLAGALLAAALMTKINFGAYALAGAGLAAVLTVEPLARRAWLRWAAIGLYLAMPFVVMASDLRTEWVRTFIAYYLLSAVAALVASRLARPPRGERQEGLWRWLSWAVAGWVGATIAILLAIVALGTGPVDLYDGMIRDAMNVRNVAAGFPEMPVQVVYWGILTLAAAILVVRLRVAGEGAPALWPGLLRVFAGLTIWLTVARAAPFGLNPSAVPVLLPMALAWVAMVPPAGPAEEPFRRFLRVMLPAAAIAGTLGIYPVPGAQVGVASLMFVPVGALCIADALVCLRAWSEARGASALQRFGAVVGVAAGALVGMIGLNQVALPATTAAIAYSERPALPFDGAGQVRLTQVQVDEYTDVVEFLRQNRCTTFIGYPNVDSLYLWADIEPPKPAAPGAWVAALDEEDQDRILEQLRASPRPCVLVNEKVAGFWLNGKTPPDTALAHYIEDEFETVGEAGAFELRLPKGGF